jgi:hypothetical protein
MWIRPDGPGGDGPGPGRNREARGTPASAGRRKPERADRPQRPARAKSSASRASGSQASSDSGSRLNHSFIGVPKDVLAHTRRMATSPRRTGGRTLVDLDPGQLVWILLARESSDREEQVGNQLTDLRAFAL